MSYTNGLNKPSDYFNTVLYTGDASSDRTITNTFGTDFLWLKERNGTDDHHLWDKVRGDGKRIHSNLTNAESDLGTYIALVSTGFKVSGGTYNNNGSQYAAWNWKAGGTAVSNTDGSITSSVSANQDAGFSIVSYTGTGSAGTVGTGLGAVPKMIIIKDRDAADNWNVYHSSTGNNSHLHINLTNAKSASSSYWNTTSPTSSVFSLGSSGAVNTSSNNFIAYCFAEKKGYSKFGSYVGNGGNQFIYTGFKPAFVIEKRSSNVSEWDMYDNKRNTFNSVTKVLKPKASDAEATYGGLNFLSNGFEAKGSLNDSGQTLIYMAFAESPFTTSTGIPTTAR